MNRLEIGNLFDTTNTIACAIFNGKKYAFEVLPQIKDFIMHLSQTLDTEKFDNLGAFFSEFLPITDTFGA